MPKQTSVTDSHETRLTSLSSCAGCAAKLSQALLADILRQLPKPTGRNDPRVRVDASSFDDAGVYELRPNLALVQTVDFFTPIVDDPYDFGQIAAANALSDIHAMGGRPITALNLLGMPADKLSPKTIAKVLRGGADKTREARCALLGGHTIKTVEPIYGLSVTGTVHPKRMLTNMAAAAGDLLVLTKPIGTGIITTAIKRGIANATAARRAVRTMKTLNTPGADLAEAGLVRAATDVTGFGLTGHLANIVRGSSVTAHVDASAVPIIHSSVLQLIAQACIPGGTQANLSSADAIVDWNRTPQALRVLLADAQTSGPLLLCVAPKKLKRVLSILKTHHTLCAAVIGRIEKGPPRIVVAG